MGLNLPSRTIRPEAPYRSLPWYCAYMAALFESDPALLLDRIRFAEHLISSRERELFAAGTVLPELQTLNSALLALHALATCRKWAPSSSILQPVA